MLLTAPDLLEVRNLTKIFGTLSGLQRHRPRHPAGRDSRAARRERRRQVDAGQDAVRRRWSPIPARSAGAASRSRIASPSAASKLGIGMVFQHFSLFEALTAAENIALSLDDNTPIATIAGQGEGGCPTATACRSTRTRMVGDLSVGERQRIEIIRCLLQTPRPDHPRRADFGADAAGGRQAVRDARAGCARRQIHPLHLRIASRR